MVPEQDLSVALRLGRVSKLQSSTETTASPEGHFSSWGRTTAGLTCGHAMNINSAWMSCPDAGFTFQLWCAYGVLLLNAEIFDVMARGTQGCQELGAVIEQGLPPLRMAGADDQNPLANVEWAAVRSKQGAC